MGLAACGTSTAKAPPTAAELLQSATNALNLNGTSTSSDAIKDLTFDTKFTIDMDLSGLTGTPSASATPTATSVTMTMTAKGKQTQDPRRAQMDMQMALLGQNVTMSIIMDYAGSAGYVNAAGLGALAGSSATSSKPWYKVSGSWLSSLGGDTSMYMDLSKLKDAKMIGGETINGVKVWHLRATQDLSQALPGAGGAATGAGSDASMKVTMDYFFRQDNSWPVKVTVGGTASLAGLGSLKLNAEMNFTAINTGVKITLPDPSEVQVLDI
jgi:hypothetical protein